MIFQTEAKQAPLQISGVSKQAVSKLCHARMLLSQRLIRLWRISGIQNIQLIRTISSIVISLLLLTQPVYALGINDGLVGWWKFDEGSGVSAVDSSGNGNAGTLNSAPTWVNGKRGNALQFPVNGGYVQIPDSASLKINTAITITAWVYPTACNASGGMIAQKRNLVNGILDYNYGFWLDGSCRQFFQFYDGGGFRNYTDTQAVALNAWSFVAVTINESASRIQFYYNGIATSSPAYAGTMPSSGTAVVQIGRYTWIGNLGFTGSIDDVRIYNRALTASEIAMLGQNRNQIRNAQINNAQVK